MIISLPKTVLATIKSGIFMITIFLLLAFPIIFGASDFVAS